MAPHNGAGGPLLAKHDPLGIVKGDQPDNPQNATNLLKLQSAHLSRRYALPLMLAAVIADGAYDQDRVYDAVAEHSAEAAVIVPPRAAAVHSPSADIDPTQRDCHVQAIAEQGRMGWQKTSATRSSPNLPQHRRAPKAR